MLNNILFIAPSNSIHSHKWINFFDKQKDLKISWISFYKKDSNIESLQVLIITNYQIIMHLKFSIPFKIN